MNRYLYLLASLILLNTSTFSQPLSKSLPEISNVGTQKSTIPFWGVAVIIPTWKIFGKKR
ncbi:hypothetical protein G8759_25725 [Spirosoma aureum]|uniref:Uncharacterized protein n=1 Tax=Spirosoma aureum TaxID=2692134 RepID=A0A6G9ATY5_9BACT|nr:hypothetical protein [Spirosoma aureum]QIP15786.1 hypothetical protein G8759_25725 [Spirosoma aureum]